MALEARIMDLTVACLSFPRAPEVEIERENILNILETVLEGDVEVAVVEGREGMGKTTLLSQFMRRHPHNTFALFVKPANRLAYDVEYLKFDLAGQLWWELRGEQLDSPDVVDDSFLRKCLLELQRRALRTGRTFFFIVDGLEEIPQEDGELRDLILGLLLFDSKCFKFLVSDDITRSALDLKRRKLIFKSNPLAPFTHGETVRYLEGFGLTSDQINDCHQSCRGIPGGLSSVRRNLRSGVPIGRLLQELDDLFEVEWQRVDAKDEQQLTMLGVLAHDRTKRHTLTSLASLVGSDASSVRSTLGKLSFLVIDEATGEVAYDSEAFRKFAAGQLANMEGKITNKLIDRLNQNPDDDDALTRLPALYQQAGRHQDLLSYLSPERIGLMLQRSRSLSPVQQKAKAAVKAALDLHRDVDLVRLCMQASSVAELEGAQVWRAEVEALMALDDYPGALNLAQSTVLQEDRLQLLAVVARKFKEQSQPLSDDLTEQIRQLCNSVDAKALGDRAIEVASDLIYVLPDLAIELVEKTTGTDAGENALDLAFVKLSVFSLGSLETGSRTQDALDAIRSRVKDPSVKKFTTEASLLLGNYSAAAFIAEVERLEAVSDRLYLLRQWITENRERSDALDAVDYALKSVIKTTEYSPNARVLRELATPLPHATGQPALGRIIGVFDSQKDAVEKRGPTEDFVRLQLLLAEAEYNDAPDEAKDRFTAIWVYIMDLGDLGVATGALARMLASLSSVDPSGGFLKELHKVTEDALKANVQRLLERTASHFSVTRRIIRALGPRRRDLALAIAQSLNTEARRDLALLELVGAIVRVPIKNVDFVAVENAIGLIKDSSIRDRAVMRAIARLPAKSQDASYAKAVLPIIVRLKHIEDAGERCRGCCFAYGFLNSQEETSSPNGLKEMLLKLLDDSWTAIDVGWHRVDVGFKIAGALAPVSAEIASTYIDRANHLREDITQSDGTTAASYLAGLRLAIRAYVGLLARHMETPEDLESLSRLIDYVPSCGERVGLWSDLALRCFIAGRTDYCQTIVRDHVRELLSQVPEGDTEYYQSVVVSAAPALYCAHKLTALESLAKLPRTKADEAYQSTAKFLLSHCPPGDPYDAVRGFGYAQATFENIVDVCELLQLMDSDSHIYYLIEQIADTIARRKKDFSGQQRLDTANRIENIANTKFPNSRSIQHEGFKVIAKAQVLRIRQEKQAQPWNDLLSAVNEIPNLADQAYIFAVATTAAPSKDIQRRQELLERAASLVEQIPSIFDRIEHYETLASVSLDVEIAMCRKFLESGLKLTAGHSDPEYYPVQRRLIDIAYRLDPNIASSLSSLIDDDPARKALQGRLRVLDLKRKVSDSAEEGSAGGTEGDFAHAAWLLLGSLNARRMETSHIEATRKALERAASLPLTKSYPIFAWVIENAVRRLANTPQASIYLRPLFLATLAGARLANALALRSSSDLKQARTLSATSINAEDRALIRAGEREKAKDYLRKWLEANASKYVKICDPYFGPEDLEVLQLVLSVAPTCRVRILTSKKHQSQEVDGSVEEAYHRQWRLISDQDPPSVDIAVVGLQQSGELPIHDRWWVTKGSGLALGASFNSIGKNKDSEISALAAREAEEREMLIDQYLNRVKRDHGGQRLTFQEFSL